MLQPEDFFTILSEFMRKLSSSVLIETWYQYQVNNIVTSL